MTYLCPHSEMGNLNSHIMRHPLDNTIQLYLFTLYLLLTPKPSGLTHISHGPTSWQSQDTTSWEGILLTLISILRNPTFGKYGKTLQRNYTHTLILCQWASQAYPSSTAVHWHTFRPAPILLEESPYHKPCLPVAFIGTAPASGRHY